MTEQALLEMTAQVQQQSELLVLEGPGRTRKPSTREELAGQETIEEK